ncbi:Protein ENHANCED DISEASE RESISTANCE 4 [Cucurbita argyrosperma subsp. argyrosperma]|nr:Protein ENHANCED DISEASE RESISTANCE 4 [Cucurbita argyrosperma subsp. argyrosperma]
MSGDQKVRVVRCPKCENLLPEPSEPPVYQCGGCGAVLRAKSKVPLNEKNDSMSSENYESLSEQGSSLGAASDTEWGSPSSKRTVFSNSPIRTNDREDIKDYEMKVGKEINGVWPIQRFGDQYIKNWVGRCNLEQDVNVYDLDYPSTAPYRTRIGAARSRASFEHRKVERDSYTRYSRNSMAVADRPSSSNFEGLNPNPAELLRRLDELKDQIITSCDVRAPANQYYGRPTYSVPLQPSTKSPQLSHGSHYQRNSEEFLHPKEPIKMSGYYNENAIPIGLEASDLRRAGRFPHSRQSSEFSSVTDGYGLVQPRKAPLLQSNGNSCDAIAGGAPFIVCVSCLELLKLPRKLYKLQMDWQKLQCGACSVVVVVRVENGRLVVSVPSESKLKEASPDDGSPKRAANATNSSDDSCHKLISTDHNKQEQTSLKTTPARKCEPSLLNDSADLPSKDVSKENSDSTSYQEAGKYREGGDENKQNTVIDDNAEPIELDVSFEDYSNIHVSQDFVETSKEEVEDQSKIKNSEESETFFVGLSRYNLRDFSRSSEIPDNGKPVVSPFIDEFTYPLSRNCAAGNTEIFVNGRELHKRDLELLSSRGLPTTPSKFYRIDISGRVVDEDTGKVLHNLGKLAPTF